MHNTSSVLVKRAHVWILCSVWLILCALPLALYKKMDIALFINGLNNDFADVFFRIFTEFGNFLLIFPVILILVFMRYRWALMASVSTLLSMILTQLMKRFVWYDSMRPKFYFKDLQDIHYVSGVNLHTSHSFPSGHTAGAFALFLILALVSKKFRYQALFLLAAALVGYSRLYLSQHFLIDVFVGSQMGMLSALVTYSWFNTPSMLKHKSLDGSLLTTLRRNSVK